MSQIDTTARPNELRKPRDDRGSGADAVADGLRFAAAPAFALMALLTFCGGRQDMLCTMMQDASPLDGMATMYLLMSAFHAGPWLKLIARSRGGACRMR